MATTSSYMASSKFTMLGWTRGGISRRLKPSKRNNNNNNNNIFFSISAQQQQQEAQVEEPKVQQEEQGKEEKMKAEEKKAYTKPRPVEPQLNVKSKNMSKEYGGQWLSSVTRHVRIYAAYIDPVTCEFDQTQMDKLTLILDPTNEFEWTNETCTMVYSYFQELVDHYEGAPLTEYTLRLIGSDIEHYIRKLLYDGEIRYNMNARVLNFSMGKPRVGFSFNDSQLPDVQ